MCHRHEESIMIAQELEVSLHMAFVEARQQRHEFITVEHLLLALLDNPSAAEVLKACAANIDDLRKSLTTFIKENTPTVGDTEEVDTQPTLGFQRVIRRAIMYVQSTGSGKKEVTGANMLLGIFGEKNSHAIYCLHQQDVTRLDVVNFIAHGIKKSEPLKRRKTRLLILCTDRELFVLISRMVTVTPDGDGWLFEEVKYDCLLACTSMAVAMEVMERQQVDMFAFTPSNNIEFMELEAEKVSQLCKQFNLLIIYDDSRGASSG